MSSASKRLASDRDEDITATEPEKKLSKTDEEKDITKFSHLTHGKGRSIPSCVLKKLTDEEAQIIEQVSTSCSDLEKVKAAIQLRIKYRLSVRLPEDDNDADYYIENGLRKVYPYNYLYQTYTKRRWIGRKLRDVIKEEFRDITDSQLKQRFGAQLMLVNGQQIDYDYTLKDNDFIANQTHRHELPVLATPIKVIFEDKETLVINKPPSVPIHPCGRYRHNSVTNLMRRECRLRDMRVVHRLDRLVSGVLMFAKNPGRAHALETLIKNREVQKEYVCRVVGEFPVGQDTDDREIIVDQPLEVLPGKIGITIVAPEGKQSATRFKRLSYNGKTSAVLCKPLTGRMHQIRVHLQYLGHPIVNDPLYNCSSFGPERGKGGRFGKSTKQLAADILAMHRANTWMIHDDNTLIGLDDDNPPESKHAESRDKVVKFLNDDERAETMAAIEHFHNDESWKELERRLEYDPKKLATNPTCRDCVDKFHDPPLRYLFLYLHALKYHGADWCYETELPVWARDSWAY